MPSSTDRKSLLVELLVEELPPKSLLALGEAFASTLAAGLRARGLAAADTPCVPYASPRRLAVLMPAVAARADDRTVEHRLMPVAVGLAADGGPTPALLKRLAAIGAEASAVDRLERRPDGKAEALFLASLQPGAALADGLQQALDEALAALPIPKVMSYQLADGWTSVSFVRPAHGLVALHGDGVVPVRALGLDAGRTTRGHRFEAAHDPIVLRDADGYAAQLAADGAVIASFAERRAELVRQLDAAAGALSLKPVDDAALRDEVAALVERPNVLACRFEPEFLAVPAECLVLTMKANQKYFPLLDAAGRLTEHFLVVSNIRPADATAVVQGNERVVRPRLADAKFFFDQDRKKTLESRVPLLDKVVYHGKLGSQGQRVERVRAIARAIGERLGGTALAAQADEAARLAKADLLTDMVGEFPELQGVMGRYYAQHEGLSDDIAYAIEDHYRPRYAGDALPRNEVGVVVALADKLETLVGLFGIGQVPTGDKDPFALRRHAIGVLRLLIEREIPLRLSSLLKDAYGAFEILRVDPTDDLKAFFYERLGGLLRESGYSSFEIDAVLSRHPENLAVVPARLAAVRDFMSMPEAIALAAANKRVRNLLKKNTLDLLLDTGGRRSSDVDPDLLTEPAERALHQHLQVVGPQALDLYEKRRWADSLRLLSGLRAPIDAFFETVMVNVDDPKLRANRLGLLGELAAVMNHVADLSKLATS